MDPGNPSSRFFPLVSSSNISRGEARCRELIQGIDTVRNELCEFRDRRLPPFRRWVDENLDSVPESLRKDLTSVRELEMMLASIGDAMLRHGLSRQEAYREVARQARPAVAEVEDACEGLLRAALPPPWWTDVLVEEHRHVRRTLSPADFRRLRTLYRALAFDLHPDHCPAGNPTARELWHEVQGAHVAWDLKRMELTHALVSLLKQRSCPDHRDDTLLLLAARLVAKLETLTRAKHALAALPAWEFSPDRAPRKKWTAQVRRMLREKQKEARKKLRSLRSQIRAVAAAELRPRPKAGLPEQLCFDF